jgi:hypothetical protein
MTKKKKYEKPLIKKVHGFDFVPKTGPGQICLLPRQECPIKRKAISAKRKDEITMASTNESQFSHEAFTALQRTCKHPEWDSVSSPGITFCKVCKVFKVHDPAAAIRNTRSVYCPVYYAPIHTKERANE